MANTTSTNGNSKRGFAAMSKQKQREIAREGGRASHRGSKPASSTTSESENS